MKFNWFVGKKNSPATSSDIIDYWNSKITSWEKKRYDCNSIFHTKSILYRAKIAATLINSSKNDFRKVTELGCGSGKLVKFLDTSLLYSGIDSSTIAIEIAQKTYKHSKNIKFSCYDVTSDKLHIDTDVLLALGLIDWIGLSSFEKILEKSSYKIAIFSYTQKNSNSINLLYEAYQFIFNYNLRPKSYTNSQIAEMLARLGLKNIRSITNPSTSLSKILLVSRL